MFVSSGHSIQLILSQNASIKVQAAIAEHHGTSVEVPEEQSAPLEQVPVAPASVLYPELLSALANEDDLPPPSPATLRRTSLLETVVSHEEEEDEQAVNLKPEYQLTVPDFIAPALKNKLNTAYVDAFLSFRALCKLSMKELTPS